MPVSIAPVLNAYLPIEAALQWELFLREFLSTDHMLSMDGLPPVTPLISIAPVNALILPSVTPAPNPVIPSVFTIIQDTILPLWFQATKPAAVFGVLVTTIGSLDDLIKLIFPKPFLPQTIEQLDDALRLWFPTISQPYVEAMVPHNFTFIPID